MKKIYLSPPHMGADELELVKDAFASNWIAPLGPHVDAFEQEFARLIGVPHAAALSSGTAALHLALQLLDVGSGDSVICPTLTFCASANPIVYQGAEPVFIDADPDTWSMNPELLREELAERAGRGRLPKAVISVDLYGQCADYGPILDICRRYEVPLIEDAAEALGATYRGKMAGQFGKCARLLVQWQQDHHHLRRRHARLRGLPPHRARPLSRDPGARSGSALSTFDHRQ